MVLVVTIEIVAWLLIVFVAACIYGQQKKDPINFAYLLFSAYAGTWVFLELILNLPMFFGAEDTIFRCITAVWIPAGFFFMNFSYALVGRKVDPLFIGIFLIAVIGSVVGSSTDFVMKGIVRYSFGTLDLRSPTVHTAFSMITTIPASIGIWLIAKKLYFEKNSQLRTPLVFVFLGALMALILAFLFNVFIPNFLGILDFPRIGSSSLSIFVVVVYFAMRRFNFLAISAESVAEELFHNVEHGLALLSPEGLVQKMNPALASILEIDPEQTEGKRIETVFPELGSKGDGENREFSLRRGETTNFYTSSFSSYKQSGIEAGTILTVRDITDDRKTREVLRVSKEQLETELQKRTGEFLQIQKMEAIGTLAGGIAHDFNNLLATILGFATAALDELPKKSPFFQDTKEIIQAAEKAKGIVSKISNFRPRSDEDRKLVQPSFAVEEALGLVGVSLGEKITLKKHTPETGNFIFVDETLFHQALLNLFTNAIYAMGSNGGELLVKIETVAVDEATALAHPPAIPGRYSKIVVSDSGEGIPEAIVNRVFEPFFTTKEVGQGTGLGLSAVLRMAKDSGGFVTVESKEKVGSTFALHLPIASESMPPRRDSAPPPPGGNEHIFFIDDNEQVARAGKRILESLGYSVRIFLSGKESLLAFKNNKDKVDIVITDESMPEMTGTELSKELLELKPELPILLVSGGETGDKIRIRSGEIGISKFLIKPLSKEALASTVRELLDR